MPPLVPSLNLKMYAGISVQGTVGAPYRIEYAPAVGETNAWTTLTNVTLPANPYLLIDYASPNAPKRFYRALVQ